MIFPHKLIQGYNPLKALQILLVHAAIFLELLYGLGQLIGSAININQLIFLE